MAKITTNPIRRTRGGIEKTCKKCRRTFRVPPSANYAMFCSFACTRNRISKQCKGCGINFEVKKSIADCTQFCSRHCYAAKTTKTCKHCGKDFEVRRSEADRQYCSRTCKTLAQRIPAPEGIKWCSMGQHFTSIKSFGKCSSRLDGLVTHCKPCKKQYESSRAEVNQRHKRTYRQRNPAKALAQRMKWATANKEQLDQMRRNYAALNPDKVKASKCRSRAKRAGATGTHLHADWLLKVEYFGWKCIYCGIDLTDETLTKDHRKPLSRGGTNFLANVAPACAKCNSAKRARSESEFRALGHVLRTNDSIDTISGSATAYGAA